MEIMAEDWVHLQLGMRLQSDILRYIRHITVPHDILTHLMTGQDLSKYHTVSSRKVTNNT